MKNIKPFENQFPVSQVSPKDLDQIILKNDYTIIDVRDQSAIINQGSIPGAINIPFDRIEDALDSSHEAYCDVFAEKKPILFCCTGGVMSYMAALKAQRKGITELHNLEGGHAAWLSLINVS